MTTCGVSIAQSRYFSSSLVRFITAVTPRHETHLVIIQVQRSKGSAPPDTLGEGLRAHSSDPVKAKLQQPHGPVPPQSMRQSFQTLVSDLVVTHVQIAKNIAKNHQGWQKRENKHSSEKSCG